MAALVTAIAAGDGPSGAATATPTAGTPVDGAIPGTSL